MLIKNIVPIAASVVLRSQRSFDGIFFLKHIAGILKGSKREGKNARVPNTSLFSSSIDSSDDAIFTRRERPESDGAGVRKRETLETWEAGVVLCVARSPEKSASFSPFMRK